MGRYQDARGCISQGFEYLTNRADDFPGQLVKFKPLLLELREVGITIKIPTGLQDVEGSSLSLGDVAGSKIALNNRSRTSEREDLFRSCLLETAANSKTQTSQTITRATTSKDKEKRSPSACAPIAGSCQVDIEKVPAVRYRKGKEGPLGGFLFGGRGMETHCGGISQTSRNCSWCFKEVMCRTCASCKEPFCGVCYYYTPCMVEVVGSSKSAVAMTNMPKAHLNLREES